MKTKSILVVEDDPYILEDLVQIFEMENYRVMRARNGLEALQILKSSAEQPGLICLDLMMPIMSGQEFLNEVTFQAEYEKFRKIPIVVISAARVEVTGPIVARLKKPPE